MKRCLTSLAIKEMQIKTTIRYDYTHIQIILKKMTVATTNTGETAEKV